MTQPVFRDPELQRRFDADGYVFLPQFLDADTVTRLKQAYFDLLPESGGAMTGDETDFHSKSEITYDFTFIDRNWEYKQKVFDVIEAAFAAHYTPVLADYTPIIANFIHKESQGGEVPLHQNWAFVDELHYTSVSIWVPLVESTRANGTLEIAPGTHKRFGRFRGPLVPWECEHIKEDIIRDFMVPMEAQAGDAVILDDSVIHYSNINRTAGLRLTIQLILIPKGVPSIHYHLDRTVSADEVRVLKVDRDFYMKFHPWKRPEGKEVGRQKVVLRYIGRGEFEERLRGPEFQLAVSSEQVAVGNEELEIRNVSSAGPNEELEEGLGVTEQRTVPEAKGFFSRLKRIFA